MPRRRTRETTIRCALAAVVASLLTAFAPALARADVEPNDLFTQAEGPLLSAPVNGTIATENDVDWYSFYVDGQQQIDLTLTKTGGNCSATMDFLDADLTRVDRATSWNDTPRSIRYSTPAGVTRFYVKVVSCANNQYRLSLSPQAALAAGEGVLPVTPTGEPNESDAQAFGPLAGGAVYGGAIDTINDQDWFYFYTLAPTPVEIELRNPFSGCRVSAELHDHLGEQLTEAAAWPETIGRLRYTLPSAGRWTVKLGSCNGQPYQLRLLPVGAFSLTPPTPPPPPLPAPPAPADTRMRPTVSLTGSGTGASARVRGTKVRLAIRGRVALPAGVTAAQACTGQVALTIKKGRTLLSARNTGLSRSCRFTKTVNLSRRKVGRASSLRVTVRFQGNAALTSHQRTFSVRVRR